MRIYLTGRISKAILVSGKSTGEEQNSRLVRGKYMKFIAHSYRALREDG